MKLARIFIDRPIVAIVMSLVILLAGLASMGRLPLTEYPNVMPPTVNVTANYPGANPGVIADTVATPLETELNGLPGLQPGDQVVVSGLIKVRPGMKVQPQGAPAADQAQAPTFTKS